MSCICYTNALHAVIIFIRSTQEIQYNTRMHSSRMRTDHSLTICCSLLPRGVCSGGVSGLGVSGLGGVYSQGVSAPGGCLVCGVLPARGVCSRGYLVQGCLVLGGVLSWGVSCPRGGYVWPWGGSPCRGGSPCQGGSPYWRPPVNRMTNRCKNITLATTSLWPVMTDEVISVIH